ncbi:hypothetical protein phytr_12000 [Candidatus Phycorickettsia trachydisci]|uniref:Aminoglycoside phosphotransferase domain-containing protein n=1 Tax=Candidatus Phycorickettsia trachydisci TaxID=2115978 RepID=A0A2P1PA51_9RICK|nr:phosphotransferase [Candidatus Phycorickettsia trachydisci]AVP88125.1 hypothetical protein phytr_12000 [Candidatus Phycorickettsia trachydisci]
MSIVVLKKAYGFKSLKILKKLGGFSSENYFALANDKPVIIKYCSDETKIQKSINISNLLLNKDFYVPNFIKCIQGNQYLKIKDKVVCLYPKIEGDYVKQHLFSAKSFESIAKSLAQIHSTQLKLLDKPKIDEDINALIYLVKSNSKGTDIDKVVLDLIQIKRHMADALPKKHLQDYPKCLIHGDFHSQNMIFNAKDNLVGILDFEEAHMGYRGEDVMHFILLSLCYNGFLKSNMRKIEMFITQCLNFISMDELEVGIYAYLKKLAGNFYLEKRLYTKNDLGVLPFLKRDAKNLRYLSDAILGL